MEPTVKSRFSELGDTIRDRVADIGSYLTSQGLSPPSLSMNAEPDLPLPSNLIAARNELVEACLELQALAEGPLMHLTRMTSPRMNVLMSLQAIHRFNIPSLLSLREEIPFGDLADRCGVDRQDFRRLMKLAIANHVFTEPKDGYIAHSAISRFIAEMPLLHNWIGLVCEEMWPLQHRVVDAIERWPGSQEPSQTAYSLSYPDHKAYFEELKESPLRSQRFADGMRYLQSAPGLSLAHLFNDLGWDSEGPPTFMVDVGGSRGSVATELLRRYPGLRCQVQDLPETVADVTAPDDVKNRLEFLGHDFFTPQPTSLKAEVYFLRSILHDWSDKYAVEILKNLVPGLKEGSRIIINEVCVPKSNSLSFDQAQLLMGYDLAMKMNFNSRERDALEWGNLLLQADSRFKLKRITCSPNSFLSIIEAVWGYNNDSM